MDREDFYKVFELLEQSNKESMMKLKLTPKDKEKMWKKLNEMEDKEAALLISRIVAGLITLIIGCEIYAELSKIKSRSTKIKKRKRREIDEVSELRD